MRRSWKGIAGFVLLTLLAACQSGGRVAERFEIPFTKYTLDNGLEVVLHQDRSDPIVAIATLLHVGSNREQPGKTGFAHFFEHMSFNDSENVPRGANRKMIGELGGLRNGATWSDGTIDKYLNEKRMVYVVVGDGATQQARIKQLGYGKPTPLDVDGNPIPGA